MASCEVVHGDMLELLPGWIEDGLRFDAVICDPPYHLQSIVKRFGQTSLADDTQTSQRGRDRADGMARLSRGFMGQTWDGGDVASRPETWKLVLDAMKPGAHLLAFGGTRTFHRMACAIEDAGFELRDTVMWLYGSGFPKSHDVAKSIDKDARGVPHGGTDPTSANHGKYKTQGTEGKRSAADAGQGFGAGPGQFMREQGNRSERELVARAIPWIGWGTALKPAWEPIIVARKPLAGTVAANVLLHGTGALNVDACRIEVDDDSYAKNHSGDRGHADNRSRDSGFAMGCGHASDAGRWPANVCHDGSDEVLERFPDTTSGKPGVMRKGVNEGACYGAESRGPGTQMTGFGDSGSASRFFYAAKASSGDRVYRCTLCGESLLKSAFPAHAHGMKDFAHVSTHPTCKPISLMRWLCRMVAPPGGLILDPFAGSGTTGQAARDEGFDSVLIEREADYVRDCRFRLSRSA